MTTPTEALVEALHSAWEEWGELTITDESGVEVQPRIPPAWTHFAAAILAALPERGWTLVPIENAVTNGPSPQLVEELFP